MLVFLILTVHMSPAVSLHVSVCVTLYSRLIAAASVRLRGCVCVCVWIAIQQADEFWCPMASG